MGAHSNLGVFSDAQALTVSAASTNYIDMGLVTSYIGVGKPVYICIRVGTAFATGTSIQFDLYTDTTSTFSPDATFPLRGAIATANLTAGTWVYRGCILYEATQRYVELYYTIVGTYDAGTIDAWLQSDPPPSDSGAQVYASPVGNP